MQSEGQLLRGLTGAIIVEGIKKFNKQAAQLPERIFVLCNMEVPDNLENSKALVRFVCPVAFTAIISFTVPKSINTILPYNYFKTYERNEL